MGCPVNDSMEFVSLSAVSAINDELRFSRAVNAHILSRKLSGFFFKFILGFHATSTDVRLDNLIINTDAT